MASKVRVPVYLKPREYTTVEDGATRGAVIGVNVYDASGNLWEPPTSTPGTGTGSGGGGAAPSSYVLWRNVREVPVNVLALAGISSNGIYIITDHEDGQSTTRSIVGESGRIDVANGDGVGGNPTIDLAELADDGTGDLVAITRDAYGRVQGTKSVTTDDLAEGASNLYFTAERAQDAVGSILVNTVTIEFTYDDVGGTIEANLSAAVVASLALADSALQPGDNVSELANDAGYLEDAPSDGKIYGRKDGAWEEVTSGPPAGTWQLSDLANPPEVWFDASVDAALVTTTVAAGNVVATVASLFNAGTYVGTAGGASMIWQRANPKFNLRGSLYFPGTSPNRLTVTGGNALAQDVAGFTEIILLAFRNDSASLTNGGAGIIYVGTPTPDASRAALLKSSTTNNTIRITGRKADGGSASGNDVGGNAGTTPQLYIAEFDYAIGAKRLRINGAYELNDPAFFTPGNSANTPSDLVCFGSASTGFWGEFEMQCGGMAKRIYSLADIEKIEGLIMHDNGIAHLLPVGHPYRDNPP